MVLNASNEKLRYRLFRFANNDPEFAASSGAAVLPWEHLVLQLYRNSGDDYQM